MRNQHIYILTTKKREKKWFQINNDYILYNVSAITYAGLSYLSQWVVSAYVLHNITLPLPTQSIMYVL